MKVNMTGYRAKKGEEKLKKFKNRLTNNGVLCYNKP